MTPPIGHTEAGNLRMTEPRSPMPSSFSLDEELSGSDRQSQTFNGCGDVMAMLASAALTRVAMRLRGDTIGAASTSQIDRLCSALISQDASQAGRQIDWIPSEGAGSTSYAGIFLPKRPGGWAHAGDKMSFHPCPLPSGAAVSIRCFTCSTANARLSWCRPALRVRPC